MGEADRERLHENRYFTARSLFSLFWYRLGVSSDKKNFAPLCLFTQGPVVRTPVSANQGLNLNVGFFFLLSKAVSRIIFSILFEESNHQILGKEN